MFNIRATPSIPVISTLSELHESLLDASYTLYALDYVEGRKVSSNIYVKESSPLEFCSITVQYQSLGNQKNITFSFRDGEGYKISDPVVQEAYCLQTFADFELMDQLIIEYEDLYGAVFSDQVYESIATHRKWYAPNAEEADDYYERKLKHLADE